MTTPSDGARIVQSTGEPRVFEPQTPATVASQIQGFTTMRVDTVDVQLCAESDVLAMAREQMDQSAGSPLAIGSVNLDHLHHFDRDAAQQLGSGDVEWLMLADGAPIVSRARKLTGRSWERLTGADLLEPLLSAAEACGASVGFFGGQPAVHDMLRERMASGFPGLTKVHYWAPARADLDDPEQSGVLARDVASADVDLLVVGLGKPRQEWWIDQNGVDTGAKVLLAFGASADFLAGAVERAPRRVQDLKLEWLYRLGKEPRRMARRYLVQGPPAWVRLRGAWILS